jgi:hypothetical protein
METTCGVFRRVATLYVGSTKFVDLCEQYQKPETSEAEKEVILSYAFVSNFGFLFQLTQKYPKLASEDKASYAAEELSKVLRDYDPSREAGPLTMLNSYLSRRLWAEINMLGHQKRKLNYESMVRFDELLLDEVGDPMEHVDAGSNEYYDQVDLQISLKNSDITENEYKYCDYVIAAKGSYLSVDAAKKLGLSNSAISYLRNSIKKKLPNILYS